MYSTVRDLLRLLPEYEVLQLADDRNTGKIICRGVQAVLKEAIDQADREIDSYVGVVRSVPLDPVPALVTNISSKLAVHHLYLRRPGVDEPEPWQRETARCMRLLEHIATGKLALGAEDGESAAPSHGHGSFSAQGRLMTRRTL